MTALLLGLALSACLAGGRDDRGALATAAAQLSADYGIPVELLVSGRADEPHVVYARFGAQDGPVVFVLPGDLSADDPVVEAFSGDLLGPCRSLCANGDLRDRLASFAVVVPLALPAVDERRGLAEFNFPVRWPEARERFGDRAGPYPGSVDRVAALSDWLLGEPRVAAAILVGEVEPYGHEGPRAGSLAAFCGERLGVALYQAGEGHPPLSDSIATAVAALPRLELQGARWQRLGASSWALDVDLVNLGGTPTGHELHASLRRARGIELRATVRSRGVSWTACGVVDPGGGAHAVVPCRAGTLRLADLDPGEGYRVRLFLTGDRPVQGGTPAVELRATSPRSLGVARSRLSP